MALDEPLDVSHLGPAEAARVRLAVSCRDTDPIPKVDDAGAVRRIGGDAVQVMHNGVLVGAGCYYGEFMTEIIRQLRGHHEPQEEVAFHLLIERLRETATSPTMLELGSFWAYYSLWFLQTFPDGDAYCVEPDLANLAVGKRNFALNGRSGTFLHAAVGGADAPPEPFLCESDSQTRLVPTASLASLFSRFGLDRVDVLLVDVQGAELSLLEGAVDLLARRAVRFIVLSTHHHSISGSYLIHERCLQMLTDLDAHVIAEHTVAESYSGDGLIAVSFDERDRDLVADITYARAGESLFGDPLLELAGLVERGVV
ncbi:MAG: FkbM family methyltransferase [Acidimicrobiia bacterium]